MQPYQPFKSRLPDSITKRLRLPLIAAPMFRVSGPELVSAACKAGIIGCFPTINARSTDELESWLLRFSKDAAASGHSLAPWSANVVMRDPRAGEHLECLQRFPPEIAIASVGSPRAMVDALAGKGTLVFADVATLKHARRAIEDKADGLVLLSAGAGGNTGHLNPFAFVRAVRTIWDGPLILAGGLIDGVSLKAMQLLGCDLGYSGTRMIAATESMASDEYRAMLSASTMDDIMLTRAFTGLDTNMLSPSIRAAGIDPADLSAVPTQEQAKQIYSGTHAPKRWKDIWSAGHTISGIGSTQTVKEIVEEIFGEYKSV